MADDPLTTEDLYGKTPEVHPSGLPVEETPEIPMSAPVSSDMGQPPPATTTEPPQTPPTPPQEPPKSGGSFLGTIGMLLAFVGLFVLGVWLATLARQFLPGENVTTTQETQETVAATPTPTDPYALWKTYEVVSGTTKKPIPGISYKLPPESLAPMCDNVACASQGTYLQGGTRFTIAPRGAGQILADFRGSAISDAGGITFTIHDATLSGILGAKEFTGIFNGKTITGYAFSQMRGYMIPVTPTLSLEINHFTPVGVTSDWAADDALFDKIVQTVVLPVAGVTITPSPTATTTSVVATPTTTPSIPSGY